MKNTNTMKMYKSYEKRNNEVSALRKSETNLDKLCAFENQSQLIDFLKHNVIDKSLSRSVNLDKIAESISMIVLNDNAVMQKFFSHSKYEKQNAVLKRIKSHIACDKRHSETRFDKRQISIIDKLK